MYDLFISRTLFIDVLVLPETYMRLASVLQTIKDLLCNYSVITLALNSKKSPTSITWSLFRSFTNPFLIGSVFSRKIASLFFFLFFFFFSFFFLLPRFLPLFSVFMPALQIRARLVAARIRDLLSKYMHISLVVLSVAISHCILA